MKGCVRACRISRFVYALGVVFSANRRGASYARPHARTEALSMIPILVAFASLGRYKILSMYFKDLMSLSVL